MPKITVTFEEQGNTKVLVELPESIGLILEKYINDTVEYDPNTGEQKKKIFK